MAVLQDVSTDKATTKRLLNVSKVEPVHCAIGVGEDQTMALLLLDKMKQPRALEQILLKAAPGAKNTRWGAAFVDIDDNPKLVKFTLNRPVQGMARRLVKTLKGTGYTKVLIVLEDGTEVESAGDEEEAGVGDGAPHAASPLPPAPPPAPPAADPAATLRHLLMALVPKIDAASAGDAARKADMTRLAAECGASIKGGDLSHAAHLVAALKTAIETAPKPAGDTAGGNPAAGAWAAAAQAWQDANDAVNTQMEALRHNLLQSDDEELHEIAELGLNAVLGNQRVRIMAAVQNLNAATPELLAREGPKLLRVISPLRAHLDSSEQVAACDDNPFGVAVSIRRTLGGALDQMAQALQATA